jgi:tryptophan halogenase
MSQPLTSITILGGGTAGWLAAAILSQEIGEQCHIHLIESPDIGTIGLGESTVPPFVGLIKSLGLDETQFMQQTDATYKLGIEFVDWRVKHSRFFHPFGSTGAKILRQEFYPCWLKAQQHGPVAPLEDFSPCQVMAKESRFFPPQLAQHTPIGGANYALHVDAERLVAALKQRCASRPFSAQAARVVSARQRDNGFIEALILDDGSEHKADFFIDCSGFHSLLFSQFLKVPFCDWSRFLPCNRALATRAPSQARPHLYTQAKASLAGWRWAIPLRSRTGLGYVYSSDFISDDKALLELCQAANVPADEVQSRVLPFATGHRQVFWQHNCLALGLAAGFIEPLEATAIHLITRGLDFFLRFLPHKQCDPSLARAYNLRMNKDFAEVRDFVQLHYVKSQRQDSAFWRHCQSLPVSDSLQERIDLFTAQGLMDERSDDLFRPSSWLAIFEGMGIRPRHNSPKVAHLSAELLHQELTKTAAAIDTMVKTLPRQEEFWHSAATPSRQAQP